MPTTAVFTVNAEAPQPDVIARAAECLRRGGLVAFPTETVYGLGVHALDREAVQRLFAAKGRPSTDPLIVHVGSVEEARPLVARLPDVVHELARRFWPGPLTIVLPRSARVPDEVTAGLDTVAIRIPGHPVARALIAAAAIPIAAPSANLFSRPSPTQAAHVLADLDGRIDMVIDGGPTTVGVESTVVDLSTAPAVLLRPGAVTIDMLRSVLKDVTLRTATSDDSGAMPSPGLLARHYAPRTPLTLFRGSAERAQQVLVARARDLLRKGDQVAIIAPRGTADTLSMALHGCRGWTLVELAEGPDLEDTARRLYAALRDADAAGADAILMSDTFASSGLGLAIKDRLQRAAASIESV